MATIRDVAQKVGLSITTVSRALNGYDDVAEHTRTRIQEAARLLDYHPNALAQNFQSNRAHAIGLILPLVSRRSYDGSWLDFVAGMTTRCALSDVDLLASMIDTPDGLQKGLDRLVLGHRVDGIIICDVHKTDARIAYLQKRHLPFVAYGRTSGSHNYSFVDVDSGTGVMQAIEHLIGLGHQCIAYLSSDPDLGFSHYRFTGYREALARANLKDDPSLVYQDLTEENAPAAIMTLLALPNRPTAVFAGSDVLAVAVLKAVRATGLTVPADLAIAVFDNSPLVQHVEPPLTAVSQPYRRLGEEAASLLLDRMAEPASPLVQRLIVPTLIVRGSTAHV